MPPGRAGGRPPPRAHPPAEAAASRWSSRGSRRSGRSAHFGPTPESRFSISFCALDRAHVLDPLGDVDLHLGPAPAGRREPRRHRSEPSFRIPTVEAAVRPVADRGAQLSRSALSTAPCSGPCPLSRQNGFNRSSTTWPGVQPFWAQLPLADRARYMRRAARGDHRSARRTRRAAQPRAGKAPQRGPHDGAAPHDRLAALARRYRSGDTRGPERISLPIFLKQKRARFTYDLSAWWA